MAETARMAVFHGAGKPFEIREYPVPEPEPGALLVRVALANVCGSDLHYWRGELDYVKMGRPLPLNTGHEHVGRVARLGPGVTTDSAGQPLAVGDRVPGRAFPCTSTSSLRCPRSCEQYSKPGGLRARSEHPHCRLDSLAPYPGAS